MPLYKAIILEDDLSIALDYEMLLKKMGIRVIGVHKSWKEVGHTIAKSRPDFMIVDLFLANNETGLEFLEKYKSLFIPAIVITGYPQKLAFDLALSLNVAAFLKKPADNSELTFTIKKLISDISNRNEKKDFIIVKERGLVEVSGQSVTEGNVAVLGESMTMSTSSVEAMTGELFTLKLKATTSGQLSELLGMNSSVTKAEAYVGENLRDSKSEFIRSEGSYIQFRSE